MRKYLHVIQNIKEWCSILQQPQTSETQQQQQNKQPNWEMGTGQTKSHIEAYLILVETGLNNRNHQTQLLAGTWRGEKKVPKSIICGNIK